MKIGIIAVGDGARPIEKMSFPPSKVTYAF